MNTASHFLFITGLLLLIFSIYLTYQRYNPGKLSFENVVSEKTYAVGVMPERIIIRDVNIDLPLIPAIIDNLRWEATTKGASYLASSPVPGDRGNSIIYGHNWPALLGSLTKVKPGQEIEIVFDTGEVRKFVVEYTATVNPDNTEILSPSSDSRITVYTCAGFLDSKRFVVTALLKV